MFTHCLQCFFIVFNVLMSVCYAMKLIQENIESKTISHIAMSYNSNLIFRGWNSTRLYIGERSVISFNATPIILGVNFSKKTAFILKTRTLKLLHLWYKRKKTQISGIIFAISFAYVSCRIPNKHLLNFSRSDRSL